VISFIVSVYDRTDYLDACLSSLYLQDGINEIIVCANSGENYVLECCEEVCDRNGADMEDTGIRGAGQCYESANMVAEKALGDWLCFPSDDSLYVQGFSRIMLETAERTGADLVYCDCIYKTGSEKNNWPPYSVLNVEPRMGKIDKTCFILRRELFKGFPPHPKFWCDGALIEQLVAQGVRHAKAPGVLVVHQ